MGGARLCGKRCSDEWSQVELRHDKGPGGQTPFVKQSF